MTLPGFLATLPAPSTPRACVPTFFTGYATPSGLASWPLTWAEPSIPPLSVLPPWFDEQATKGDAVSAATAAMHGNLMVTPRADVLEAPCNRPYQTVKHGSCAQTRSRRATAQAKLDHGRAISRVCRA